MNITSLEFLVLQQFCRQENRSAPDAENVAVIDRRRSAVGFMTDISMIEMPSNWHWPERVYNRIPDAIVGGSVVGFLLFFEQQPHVTIEGYVYGNQWPEIEAPIQFTPLPAS